MKIQSVIGVAAIISVTGVAHAADAVCTRGDDQRTIRVVQPGDVGKLCDVQYAQSNGEIRTPFHADNSLEFCQLKANDLSAELMSAGFTCSETVATNNATTAQTQSDYVVEARRPDATSELAPLSESGDVTAEYSTVSAVDDSTVPQQYAVPAQAVAVGSTEVVVPQPVEDTQSDDVDLEIAMSDILAGSGQSETLEEPAPVRSASADRGPAKLMNDTAPAPQNNVRTASVGRVVGVTPDPERREERIAPEGVQPVIQASATEQTAAPSPAAASAPEPVLETPTPVAKVSASDELRTPQDVIRAVLRARAAAWNEGNLDAFMETYWRDDDLKFVSGSSVNKGWSAAMKRYREDYGRGELGVVQYDRMDVSMVTDDVAVVSGRYNLVRNDATQSGTVSLVLRQMDGVWRIVHDHTNPDAVATDG